MSSKPIDSATLFATLPESMRLDVEDLLAPPSTVAVSGSTAVPEDVLLLLDPLPEDVRTAVEAAMAARAKLSVIDRSSLKYSCVYMVDGEYPFVVQYPSLEGMLRAMGQELGNDVFAIPFFGVPLTYTKGSPRYLLLPDRLSAVNVPLHVKELIQTVSVDLLDLDEQPLQDDFYIGPESAPVPPRDEEPPAAPRARTKRDRGYMDGRKPNKRRPKSSEEPEDDDSDGDDDSSII